MPPCPEKASGCGTWIVTILLVASVPRWPAQHDCQLQGTFVLGYFLKKRVRFGAGRPRFSLPAQPASLARKALLEANGGPRAISFFGHARKVEPTHVTRLPDLRHRNRGSSPTISEMIHL
jgi:hypothetical protein